LALCTAPTTGQEIAGWKIPKPAKVRYVDGETSQSDLRKRCRELELNNENFLLINHDAFFGATGTVFCLSDDPPIEDAVMKAVKVADTEMLSDGVAIPVVQVIITIRSDVICWGVRSLFSGRALRDVQTTLKNDFSQP
jgi:hypothetical protein